MVGLTILAACGFALLSGCGASGNTNKLKSMAVRYVKEKYGFKAKSKRVSNDGISWHQLAYAHMGKKQSRNRRDDP